MELTEQQYQDIKNTRYSFGEKLRAFFRHIYMVAFAPHDAKRKVYLDVFEAFERRSRME